MPWEKVAIYRDASHVPGRYAEVGLLHTTGDYEFSGEGTMYNSMKKSAGQMGANGIILESLIEPGTGAKLSQAIFGTSADRKGKAIAIYVFTHADSAVAGEAH